MAVAWVSTTAHAGNPTTSATVTLPTTAADDILIVTVNNGGANAALTLTTGTFTLDTSLALIGSGGGWATGWGGTYWVRCSGDHSGQTIIATGATDSCSMLVQRFSGCATSGNPYDTNISEATVAAGANCALAAFNTTLPNTLVVYAISVDDNQNTSAMTKGGSAMGNLGIGSSTGGADSHVAMASLAQAATGTTGAFAATLAAGTNSGKRATAFALKEPPTVVSGGVASEADSAPAATFTQPQVPVSGGVASEADSGPAATVSQPQAPVAGGVASEADSAPAATVDQAGGAFSPDDIAGLECWLKADAIGLADGDPVTTWQDSHTSNNDATGASGQTLQTNEINGLPVVRFDGTDDKLTVSGITNNDATRTIFMVARAVTHATGDCFFGFVTGADLNMTGSGQVRWNQNQAAGQQTIEAGTGVAGVTVRVITMRFNSTSSADAYSLDGAAQNFDPNDVYQSGSSPLNLGARVSTFFGNVDIAEFLVFDSALVDTDLDAVRGYLLDKWVNAPQTISGGVASEADSAPAATVSQPQAPVSGGVASEADSAPAATVDQAFSPTDITGLYAWYDADQLGLADNDPVSSWTDESGGGRHMTGAATPLYKTGVQNGLPGVLFDGTDDTLTATVAADASRTIFIVAKKLSSTTGGSVWSMSNTSARVFTGSGSGWLYNAKDAAVGGGQANIGTAAVADAVAGSVISLVLASATSLTVYGNGVDTVGAFDPHSIITTATGFRLSGIGASQFFSGYVFEVIAYDTALSDTDREAVETYLLDKWIPAAAPQTISGGVASEADSAPVATVSQPQAPVSGGVASEDDSGPAATVSQPQAPVSGGVASEADSAPAATVDQAGSFSPTDITGLYAWYDADQLGLADNDPVSSWTDESGGGRHLTGTAPTFKTGIQVGKPGVLFDGTDDQLTVTVGADTSRTLFIVAKKTSAAADRVLFQLPGNLAELRAQITTGQWYWNSPVTNVGPGSDPATDTAVVSLVVSSVSLMQGWVDGVAGATFDPDNSVTTGTTLRLSGRSASLFWDGYVFEMLVYDTALGTTDRQSVETYLLDKWINAPQTVSGGVATETDSAPAATVSQPQAPVSGGVASEADSAPAATKIQPQVPVSGGVASEADSANAATVSQPQPPVQAGVASEADSVPAGTVDQASGDQTIFAGVASETDSVPAGTPTGGAQPPDTNPELGGVVSEPTLGGVFDESVTGGTFVEPSHGGNVTEPTLGGVFDETATGGDVIEPEEGADIDNLLGGVIDEVLTNGSVTEFSINGSVTEPALNGAVTEPDLGALLDEAIRSSQIDEATRSGTPDESTRGGTIDEVLTGGEIF
jgi:hypothetical protein